MTARIPTAADLPISQAMVDAWLPLIPRLPALPSPPRRVILHWTAGSYTPNEDYDLKAYHFVVAGNTGWIMPGRYPVSANLPAPGRELTGSYAAHTGAFNTGSVGISFAGMAGANVARRTWGKYPLQAHQVLRGLAFTALAMKLWKLEPSSPSHLFSHYEAWTRHGVRGAQNDTKPDIRALPFLPATVDASEWCRQQASAFAERLLFVCP